jgi:hypothetical protein
MRFINALVLSPAMVFVLCGVFDPRPSEYPSVVSEKDPFKFESLLWGTDKKFAQLDYQYGLFNSPATYVDINGISFDDKTITQHLYDIQDRFKIVSISWTRDSLQDYTREDTFFFDRKYHVVARDTLIIPPKEYDFNDKASFKMLLTSTMNEGNIFYWKDNYPGKSIFHPQFQPDY